MPTCHLTLSESVSDLALDQINQIRDIVAEGLNSGARYLDRDHIVIRIHRSQRELMLGDMEIEIFAQFFLRRYFSRDKRAKFISNHASCLLKVGVATWINMSIVGYSRVTVDGTTYFSDKSNQAQKPINSQF